MLTIAIDRGGTFTDVYANNNGTELVFKLLSVDPANYSDAPTEGVRRVLECVSGSPIPKSAKLDLSSVEFIRMGTTVATNALLERAGDRVALVTTAGFKDILQIGQQARPDIFDLKVAKLQLLYDEVVEINERLVPNYNTNGPFAVETETEPDLTQVEEQLKAVKSRGITSLAIALLHSYLNPDHEMRIADLATKLGFENVSVSSQLQPMMKLVSRANSACCDAYLSPIIQRYLTTIASGFKDGLDTLNKKLFFMQSDGGLTTSSKFCGLKAVLSGPAGGVVGYARTSFDNTAPVLGFDMGGTSTDVSRFNGSLEHVFETVIAEVTLQAPQLAIDTVAAGGGSILSFRNGLFKVGPESASAHPGPACYRKGGPLTVTDANLLLGRIDIDVFPHIFGKNEDEGLDIEIVKHKFGVLQEQIRQETSQTMSIEQIADGFLKVANETMCRPIRKLTEGRGFNACDHKLACFGGAGGQHAAAIARTLGISEVIIHKYSSLLSAFGIALADVVSDVQKPVTAELPNEDSSLESLNTVLLELQNRAVAELADQGLYSREQIKVERYLNCHYKGSDNLVMMKMETESFFETRLAFIKHHEREFGFSSDRPVLVSDARVRAVYTNKLDTESLLPSQKTGFRSSDTEFRVKKVYFDGEWTECRIYDLAALEPGTEVSGPAIVLDNTQTLVVDPKSVAKVCLNHVILAISGDSKPQISTSVDPVQLSVFGHRFMSIAEQMGYLLQKTAISVNIKERLDFSCAVFDSQGGLVANAPHIPVHLGSMSSQVKCQLEMWENKLEPGDVLVANHPEMGGSHLPDITVITPVFENGKIIFWVASRGHHSDIGGISAGSMPPFSHFIWEEGACIKGHKIVSKGKQFDEEGMVKLLFTDPAQYPNCSGSRSLADSLADLKAQIAANNKGIQLIHQLANEYTLPVVQMYMQAIQDNAELAVRRMLLSFAQTKPKLHAVDYLDDGSPIELSVQIDPKTGSAVFDFEGTGPQVYGNLNSPTSITHSAILYCLRSMISENIPLNQGCLAPLSIRIPPNSLLSPGHGAATVGGNVETSQRVCDVVLKAFEVAAGSQGTCNNFSFGCEEFGYYETIGGGSGAGNGFHGQSGVQVHMTNTRATDAEVLERRYPVLLRQFKLRTGSGGDGEYNGGDGVVREFQFKRSMQVSILSERRSRGPYGLQGGEPGQPGFNYWIPLDMPKRSLGGKNTIAVNCDDRVIIETPGGGAYGKKKLSETVFPTV